MAHRLGTDDLGRDILSRLLSGARYSLLISVVSVAIAIIAGVCLGIFSGYIGGAVDEVLMRILDSFMALPSLVLALAIAAALGPGLANAMLAIAVAAVPTYARLVRGQTLSIKENEYILAARATGVGSWGIVGRHVLPNSLGPVIVQASLGLGFAIITESSSSFIGLGIQPPLPTWGLDGTSRFSVPRNRPPGMSWPRRARSSLPCSDSTSSAMGCAMRSMPSSSGHASRAWLTPRLSSANCTQCAKRILWSMVYEGQFWHYGGVRSPRRGCAPRCGDSDNRTVNQPAPTATNKDVLSSSAGFSPDVAKRLRALWDQQTVDGATSDVVYNALHEAIVMSILPAGQWLGEVQTAPPLRGEPHACAGSSSCASNGSSRQAHAAGGWSSARYAARDDRRLCRPAKRSTARPLPFPAEMATPAGKSPTWNGSISSSPAGRGWRSRHAGGDESALP